MLGFTDEIDKTIDDLSVADVQEVRHGHPVVVCTDYDWNESEEVPIKWACSLCGCIFEGVYKYCPRCGARMDGEEK